MKSTTFAIGAFLSYASVTVYALPTDSTDATSTAPFHDCIDSGKSWAECRQSIDGLLGKQEIKRDSSSSNSPFHDCFDAGNSWSECRLSVSDIYAAPTPTAGGATLVARDGPTATFEGTYGDLGENLGGTEKCYSVNSLGGTGWLTNGAVQDLEATACSFAVEAALAAGGGGVGKFSKTLQGFYMGNGGPIVDPKVKFFLSVLFQGDYGALNLNVKQLGKDLCTKGLDHLTRDPGCTAPRKAGEKVEHTSVNGGEFNWVRDGAQALFDNTGLCTNCLFSMVMEAANNVDKDGKTSTPIDS